MMDQETEIVLKALIAEYRELLDKIKSLEKTKNELKTELLTLIKINDTDVYEDDTYKLELSKMTRKTFDKEAAIAFLTDNGEDVNKYIDENEFEMLKVVKKRNGGNIDG